MSIGLGLLIGLGGSPIDSPPNKVVYFDNFDRVDDALTVGPGWTNAVGTFGINGGRLYSASDVSGDVLLRDPGITNFTLRCATNCQTAGSTNQRILNIVFHALDNLNFLMTRIANGTVELWKNVAGTLSRIAFVGIASTDNVDEGFTIVCSGNNILIYVRNLPFLNYTLTAGEAVYAGYTKAGFRLGKVGAPAGTARADNFVVEKL